MILKRKSLATPHHRSTVDCLFGLLCMPTRHAIVAFFEYDLSRFVEIIDHPPCRTLVVRSVPAQSAIALSSTTPSSKTISA
jgi:hypothetical protein